MPTDDAVYQVARRQLGLITTAQALAAGLSPDQLRTRCRRRQLVRLRPGVYGLPGTAMTLETKALAAVLAAPPGAVVSHLTAGILWCPEVMAASPGPIHLTAPGQGRLQGVIVHRGQLPPWQRGKWSKCPITTPARTVYDLARQVKPAVLEEVSDDMLRRGLVRLPVLQRLADEHGAPVRLQALMGRRPSGYRPRDSSWEAEMDELYDRLGLPPAVRQYEIVTPTTRYRVDRALVELRIGIEWNGYRWHGGRAQFDADADREADLASVGWQILGFTARSSPSRIRAAVLGAVESRRHRAG